MNIYWDNLSDTEYTMQVVSIAMDLAVIKRDFGRPAMIQAVYGYCDEGYIEKCGIKDGVQTIKLPKELKDIITSESLA